MKLKTVNEMERANREKVRGISVIKHRIRLELNLSLEEYVVMDFIFNHNTSKSSTITFGDCYKETGLIYADAKELISGLKTKGCLILDATKNRIDVCPDWYAHFSTGGQFEEIWRMHMSGNKATAKSRLARVLKKISYDDLKKKLSLYLKACDESQSFKKNLDTWLNPDKEHWNDIVQKRAQIGQTTQSTTTEIKFKK